MASSSSIHFTRILFESDTLEVLQAIRDSLSSGHFEQTIEWLTAWQDVIDPSSSLFTPIFDSLQEDDPLVVSTALLLMTELMSFSPDYQRIRIQNELKELNFEQLLGRVSLRWSHNREIKKLIGQWFGGEKKEEIRKEDKTERMADVEPVLSDLRGLLIDDTAKEQRIRVVLGLLDTLKNINNPQDAERTLQQLGNQKSPPPPAIPVATPPLPSRAPAPPPPPPPPSLFKGTIPPPPPLLRPVAIELPPCMKPKKVPDKDVKMKTLMWSKLPPSALTNEGKESVWGKLASEPRGCSLDFEVIEGMFCLSSNTTSNSDLPPTPISLRKKDTLVDLLTPKRSQNVTITLKRFKDLEGVLTNIREDNADFFELEMLRALKGILPDEEEVEALRRYEGDVSLLSPACSFFLQILTISDYRLRIDCMCYRLEFRSTIDDLLPQLDVINRASLEILTSDALKRLLLLLVNIGNFLNGTTAHGNAAGFKLNSLWKMIDMKAVKGGVGLLHALAKIDENLLKDLEKELTHVKVASESSIEEAKSNFRHLGEQAKKLEKSIKAITEPCFVAMLDYLTNEAREKLLMMEESLTILAQRQEQLAAYFCENKTTFKAEECFKIFTNFISRLRVAVQESHERALRAVKKIKQNCDENVATDGKEILPEEKLFATLEKGSLSSKGFRRRSSVRTTFDYSRERDLENEIKMTKIKEKLDEEEKKDESPTETPRVIRKTRRSFHMEDASTLNDLLEKLQASSFPRPQRLSQPSKIDEKISVAIPNESDPCTSSPGASSKSSDEGFESEKDKESTAAITEPLATRRIAPMKETKTPRLVSITTTGIPPNKGSTLPRPSQIRGLKTNTEKKEPTIPPLTRSTALLRSTITIRKPQPTMKSSPPLAVVKQPSLKKPTSILFSPTIRPQPKPVPTPRRSLPTKTLLPTKIPSVDSSKTPVVSTSSRPSLIKPQRPSLPTLRGLDIVEKPRPLKKTMNTTMAATKPKWV